MRLILLRFFLKMTFVFCTIQTVFSVVVDSTAPPGGKGYRLVFADNFDSLSLSTLDTDTAPEGSVWYEGVWFSQHHAPRERFTIANSTLLLEWRRGQLQPDSSISTFSRTNRHYHAWRYGYFEARMKWQPQPGAWPAFWLIPIQSASGSPPRESGEIDIFEGQGNEPHTFFGTIHRWNGSRQIESSSSRNRFPLPPSTDFAEYHTYGLLWVPGRVTWFFDDVPLHSEQTYPVFDQQDYFLILGMQEGVDWKAGNLTGVTARSLKLAVDWVRVWQS